MKINPTYSPVAQLQKPPQPQTTPAAERGDAEARLKELIAQKHAELDGFRPFEELGKHLDLRA